MPPEIPKLPRRLTTKKLLTWLLTVGLIMLLVAVQKRWLKPPKAAVEQQPGLYRVITIYDGDTISVDMNGTAEKVRLIGVDTPETHDPRKAVQCFGKSATRFTTNIIDSHRIRLAADPDNTNRDRYNRLLRYVYLPDGRLVNAEIIKHGYGFAYTGFPFTKLEQFRTYQKQARQKGLGLWSQCQPMRNQYGGYTSNDAR